MAAVAATAAQVGIIDPIKSLVKSYIANAAITKGQACYITTAGKADLCDANGSGTLQFRGIAPGRDGRLSRSGPRTRTDGRTPASRRPARRRT